MSTEVIHRRGRGSALNPANRFERLHTELEAGAMEEAERRSVPTEFLRDTSKSALSENTSPDVPFRYSLNPYRGCEHGCVYCLDGGTRVLMADSSTRALRDLVVGDRIYGTRRNGHYRQYEETTILAHWRTDKQAFRVTLEDGTELIASGDHRFMTERGWKYVTGAMHGRGRRPYLTTNNRLLGVGKVGASVTRIHGQKLKSSARLGVVSIESIGMRELFDITTGTADFIANGVLSHNCYARPSHEYLGFSAGLDFETRIVVKQDAPKLLEAQFERPDWEPQVIAMSGVTDPYQPAERKLQVTRQCLDVLHRYRNPVGIITKNHMVTRDLDILREMAALDLVHVFVSITSLDDEVIGKMEPRTSRPSARLSAIRQLTVAGIPTGVMVAPVVPGLTDEEMPAILEAAAEHGATRAGYMVMRLPGAVEPIFDEWLDREYPLRAERIRSRVRSLRGGRMNDPRFGTRMSGTGHWADLFRRMFEMTTYRLGLNRETHEMATHHFRRSQGELF